MKEFIILIIFVSCFQSCSLDKPKYSQNVIKDFNLGWWNDSRYTALFTNNDHSEYGGREIIPETVVEIGYNEDFIIAKQHPNIYKEIESRVLQNETELGFELESISDTVYLPKEFLVVESGKWYLQKEGANHLGYLFPYEGITNYYIVVIKDYRLRFWSMEGNVFSFSNKEDFNTKRIELGIPEEVQLNSVNLANPEG